jgi:uncharacterized protein involved in exopolysaccharide biosynthesis
MSQMKIEFKRNKGSQATELTLEQRVADLEKVVEQLKNQLKNSK